MALLCVKKQNKSRSASVYSQAVGKWQRSGTEPGEHVNHAEEEEEEEKEEEEDDEGLSLDPRGAPEIMSVGTMVPHFLVFHPGR